MTKTAQDYAKELTAIVDASANALATLNRVLELQQQSILMLASEGSVPAPSTMGAASALRPMAAQDVPSAPATDAAPPVASPKAASPGTPSPDDLLAQAGKTAEAMIAHAPEAAIAHLYLASAHAVSLALMNTAAAQQQLNIVAQAVVTRGAANQLSQPRLAASPPAGKPEATAPPASSRGQAQRGRAR